MKHVALKLIFGMLALGLCFNSFAQFRRTSDQQPYPYTNTLKNSDVFIIGVVGVTNKNIAASNMLSAIAGASASSFQNGSTILSNVVSGTSNRYVGSFVGLITTGDVTNGSGSRVAYLSDTNGLGGVSGAASTNEIFSYILANPVSAAATNIVLDRDAAFPQTTSGRVAIGYGSTNCELRPATIIAGETISFTRPLTFAHAASDRVIWFGGDRADGAWWGLVPSASVNAGPTLLHAIRECAMEDVWFNGGGAYSTEWPLVAPPSARIQNITITAKAGYTGSGHTNAYMLWSSQGERFPFTATAVDDTITFASTWSPPAGDATNSIVVFYGLEGALPAPLSNGIPYFVHVYSSTTMKVGLSTNPTEIVDITANGTGYAMTEVGSLHRLYLRDIFLNGGAQVGLNGIYASMQQPAYWAGFVRLSNFGGIGVRMNGQDMVVDRLQIGVCGTGLDLRRDYGQQSGMQFLRLGSLNVEEYTNAIVGGGGNNMIQSVHLETPMTDTAPDVDCSEATSIFIKNFYATHGPRSNTVFRMGTSGSVSCTYDIESGYINSTIDADTLLLDDRFRHRQIFAYKTATGAVRSFGHLQSITVPDFASFSDMWGGNTLVGPDGRFYHLGMFYGPWLRIGAGTNDTTDLTQWLRSDDTTNSAFNANGDFTSKSNAAAGRLFTSDANGLGKWTTLSNHVTAINVIDYGADPTAGSDSHASIQAALNAVPSGGGRVFIPEGGYNVSARLTLKEGTTLEGACSQGGDQTTLWISGTGGIDTILLYAEGRDITVKNLNINGSSTTLHTGFSTSTNESSPTYNFRLDNVQFREMKIGAYLYYCWNGEIIGCGSSGCMNSGMFWTNQVNSVHVIGGDWAAGGNGMTVVDDNSVGNVISSAFEGNTNGIVATNGLIGFTVAGSYFEGNKKYDIFANGGPDKIEQFTIKDSVFLFNHIGTNIMLANIDSATVRDNVQHRLSTNVWLSAASTVQNLYNEGNGYRGLLYNASSGGTDIHTNALFKGVLSLKTNYVAANFTPAAGLVKLCASNGALYSVTQISTNLISPP